MSDRDTTDDTEQPSASADESSEESAKPAAKPAKTRKKKAGTTKKRGAKADASKEAPPDERPPPPPQRRSTQAIVLAVIATLALSALDLWTKDLAVDALSRDRIGAAPPVCEEHSLSGMQRFPGEPYVLVEGYLELRYAENCGAAFGLLDSAPRMVRRGVFGVAGIAAIVFLFMLFIRGSGGPWFAYSVPLIVSGAVGNFVDRARLEYVVDFIRFHVRDSFEYPIFNVADITITVGVVMLVIDSFLQEKQARRPAAVDPASDAEAVAGEG